VRDAARDVAAAAGGICLVAAGFTIAVTLGLVVAGVGLIAIAVLTAPQQHPTEGNDGSD
jgi:hypothetical protein